VFKNEVSSNPKLLIEDYKYCRYRQHAYDERGREPGVSDFE
jgi:hypothetical protein